MGLGVVGEYVGRIYEQVRQRPRYTIAAVLEEPRPAERLAPLGAGGERTAQLAAAAGAPRTPE